MSWATKKVQEQALGYEAFMEYWWSKKSRDIRTSTPAKVLAIDYDKSVVRVQPLIKVFTDRTISQTLPEEVDIPLHIVSANDTKAALTMPVKVGDIGILEYADQDTADYLSGNGKDIVKTPSDTAQRENLSTGMKLYPLLFTVGMFTKQAPLKIDPINVVLYNEKSFLVMSPDGKMVMHNDNGKMTMSANGDFKADTGNGSSLEMLVSGTNTLTNSVSTLTMAGAVNTLTNGISSLTMVGAVNTLTNGTSVIGQTAGMCTVNGCQITP
ncbi:MAG: hypothetical protein GY928_21230, partial [Colwellia sp.]|nr:hypothetical protein [Colwellia sp.]